jgi:NAD+ synthase (glutamine-hydrolysing)
MYYNGFIKVAAACSTTRLGDSMFNVKEMLNVLKEANKKNPAFVCFPELCITGYSIGDLLFQKYLYQESLTAIRYLLDNNPYRGVIIFGSYVIINDTLYNCSFVVQNKKILGIIPKIFLPHTNEFYETRWFASGHNIINNITSINLLGQEIPFGKLLFENEQKDVIFGAEICGDIWAPTSPNEKLFANGALIVFNSSASPSYIGKNKKRHLLTKSTTMKFNSAYVYTSNNASESSSEVIFSSHLLISENGNIVSEADEITLDNKIIYGDIDIFNLHNARRNNSYYKQSSELSRDQDYQRVRYELERRSSFDFEKKFDKLPFVPKEKKEIERIITIQAMSVLKRLDYVKTEKTVLGLSGGLDSTLALLSLCDG